jgi:O-acetyl-ADP-ribose deacetylase (regulator of RNase III)
MFKNATVISPKAPAASKKSTKQEIALTGLLQLAELDAAIKALGGMKEALEQSVKAQAFDEFMDMAADGTRPESFRGVEGIASASVEMRKRSTNSALTESEVALLEAHGLKAEKVIATPKLFGINPKHAENTELLAAVEAALADIVPEDFIVIQEERSKMVVGDAVIEQAFKSKSPREVIQAVTTMALKPKLETTNIEAILADVRGMLATAPVAAA